MTTFFENLRKGLFEKKLTGLGLVTGESMGKLESTEKQINTWLVLVLFMGFVENSNNTEFHWLYPSKLKHSSEKKNWRDFSAFYFIFIFFRRMQGKLFA